MFHLFLFLYYQVVSLTEYHRRIDALNSEDLRSLCKRLQVPWPNPVCPLFLHSAQICCTNTVYFRLPTEALLAAAAAAAAAIPVPDAPVALNKHKCSTFSSHILFKAC